MFFSTCLLFTLKSIIKYNKVDPTLYSVFNNSRFECVGLGNTIKEGSNVYIELDLRSEEKKKRTAHFIIDGKLQECFFFDIPESVRISVY